VHFGVNVPLTQRTAAILAMQELLARTGYVLDRGLAVALQAMSDLGRPLLVEGDPGVGKTEVAKALAQARGTKLIRLQCYEGLDTHHALYEWNYQRQLLAIRIAETRAADISESDLFGETYLLRRPLLAALSEAQPPVLLIDEIDRADEAFEAFLLELLSDFQVTVPEFGTIRATSNPLVVLTSNGTRELSDALRRRCLYHFIDYPDFAREFAIVTTRLPNVPKELARQAVEFVQSLRLLDLRKKPGVAESLDWINVLFGLGLQRLQDAPPGDVRDTLIALLKTREDSRAVDDVVFTRLLAKAS
jgi:MoxR-like ATPase